LSRSVPSPSEAQATFAATLFDEWIRSGLTDVVLSPGSRSTPLALAAASRGELRLHVRLDERSAGFFALGRALATNCPVAMIVTSGTAATELHACVAEADLAHVPLLIVTADRPPELHGVGAPQTIEQAHLYGDMVRHFEDPGVANADNASSWRELASRLWLASIGDESIAGPVHLNAAFVEPLVAEPLALPEGRPNQRPWREASTRNIGAAALDVVGQSVLCVVGAGVSAEMTVLLRGLDWVVLGDATARGTLAHFDPILRVDALAEALRPDVVIRLGGLPASKVLAERLRSWGAPVIALDGAGPVADPDRIITSTVSGTVSATTPTQRGQRAYVDRWRRVSERVASMLDARAEDGSALDEPDVARVVIATANANSLDVVVGSSMPVRDVEWWASARTSRVFANRGVNGIDGVVSTALGVASGSLALGLIGDLTMLHDVSGLVEGLGPNGGSCVLVVVDNRGGGIFSFLAQAQQLERDQFEQLFGTPRFHDLETIATAFGHAACSVSTSEELRRALDKGLTNDGVSVVVAKVVSREQNVRVHDAYNEAVANLFPRGVE
jgi:2-succinyl-5-enolpyruvyl-6-hydroxy-3-cyclohexene-1-carboxylate synthase